MKLFMRLKLPLPLRSFLYYPNDVIYLNTFRIKMSSYKRSAESLGQSNSPSKVSKGSVLDSEQVVFTPIKSNMNSVEVMQTPDKSENDKKLYRVICLSNGLRALLVSDPEANEETSKNSVEHKVGDGDGGERFERKPTEAFTAARDNETDDDDDGENESDDDSNDDELPDHKREKLSACALCVDVGSFSDPRDVQGLAHFLEHMIFMGSEKYPSENEFDQYIKKSGGFDNADTDLNETSFYFETRQQCLDGALDRFSQFFKSPLMLKDAMTRERKAVESEFSSKMNGEDVRREQLISSIGQSTHPASIFSWGNLKTLKDNIDDDVLYQKVHDFRKRHYSAHRMYVCLQSRQPLDDLQELVVKHFSTVPNNQLAGDDFSGYTHRNAFESKFYEKVYFVKPIGNISKIDITWCLEPMLQNYKTKPDHYLSFILGHEGKGSLLSYLRKKLWAIDLAAGTDQSGLGSNSLFSLFAISIHLTDDGFANLEKVLEAIFSFVRFLKAAQPNEKLFHEIQSIEANSFRFAHERDALENVEDLVINLKQYPPKYILTGDSLFFEYNSAAIRRITDELNTRKFNIMITSSKPYDENVRYELKEQWFGTEYSERNMPEQWILLWENAKPFAEFTLPDPNPYIADDFTLFYDPNQVLPKHPIKILDNEVCELWFRQDDKFLLPVACYNFYFMTPQAVASTDNMILMTLMATLLKYQLVEKLYPATAAALEYSCYSADKGLVLKLNGFNQKLHLIVSEFTKCLKSLADDTTEKQFQVFVDQQFKTYENIFLKPKALAKELRLSIVEAHHVPLCEKNQRLRTIRFADFQNFCREYSQNLRIKAIMQGNLTEDMSASIMQNAQADLKCSKVENLSLIDLRATQIPAGANYLRCSSFNANDVNTVITNVYQIGPISFRTHVLIDLLVIIADEPLFDTLRTKENIAYDVSCGLRDNYGILSYAIIINSQENKFSVKHVDERIESFRNELISIIENMSNKEFDEYKASLAKIKLTEDNKLEEEITRNWSEITTGDYVFDRTQKEVENLCTITKDDLLQFYRDTVTNEHKLSVQVIGNVNREGNENLENEIKEDYVNNETRRILFDKLKLIGFDHSQSGHLITDLTEFKKSLNIYPVVRTSKRLV